MKPKELASYLAKLEAGKSNGKLADKRQDIANLSDLIFKTSNCVIAGNKIVAVEGDIVSELYKNGERRAARKKKARK